MTESIDQLFDDVVRGRNAGTALDTLIALGDSALTFLCSAIERGQAIFTASDLLGRIEVQDRIAMLASLATDPRWAVRHAAISQLGRTGDPRAISVIEDLAAKQSYQGTFIEALGGLGAPALIPLRKMIDKQVGDIANPEVLAKLCAVAIREEDPSELDVVASGAKALAKLGDFRLTDAASTLARFTSGGAFAVDAGQVRLRAIAALDVSVGAGVASVLAQCCSDPDEEVAKAASAAELHLGRIRVVDHWLSTFETADGTLTPHIRWCLSELTGRQAPEEAISARVWWEKRATRYEPASCYRFGIPASPARLIIDVRRPNNAIARAELRQMIGVPFLESTLSPLPTSDLAALDAWWTIHAGDFTPGKLHRWGRTYEPDACD